MKIGLTIVVTQALLTFHIFAQQTHLDIMVPELKDTDLSGPVKSVDTKVSFNVSGKFERERTEYDRVGNILVETSWDPEGECISTLTNYYSESGNFERQLYMDFEDKYTNDWEVILSPDTHQIAMREAENGSAAVYTYSPAGYLVSYRYVGGDKKLRAASHTKRDEQYRRMEHTRMDDRKKPLYTYWFRWKDDNTIDRERQRYRQEKGERLHIYDYLKTDDHNNWVQRLMVRYDIGGEEKEKVYERLVVRTIEYYEPEEAEAADIVATETPDTVATEVADSLSTNDPAYVAPNYEVADLTNEGAKSTNDVVAPSHDIAELFHENGELKDNTKTAKRPEVTLKTGRSQEELKGEFDYTFDDLSDKLVIVSCKSDAGRSSGSGFVAKMNGRTYLFTNQHVIMGADTIQFRTASGETLSPRSIELSKTRDIARILIQERDGFEVCEKFSLGSPLGVFGNSEGAGVATELFGEVTGLGVDVVEINAEFVSGNSGSPVLDTNQEVIGIASFVRVTWTPPKSDDKESKKEEAEEKAEEDDEESELESKTRRFCYRLDDLKWQSVKWKSYNNKYGKLYLNSEAISANVFGIINIWGSSPLESIPTDDGMAHDLAAWVDKHNDIIRNYNRRKFSRSSFFSAYSGSLETLSEICNARSRRIRMFSKQRELSGFLRSEFERNAYALDYASHYIQIIADSIKNQ